MITFKIGDIIRNIKPYWGEPIKRIIEEDKTQYYVQQGPGKFGLWENPNYREIIFKKDFKYYRKARLSERIYLYILGWFIEKLSYNNREVVK